MGRRACEAILCRRQGPSDADAIAASDALRGGGDPATLMPTYNLALQQHYAAYSALFEAVWPPLPNQ